MTSRNSFLARLTENAKRRTWLWVVSLLVFVIIMPTCVAMYISRISSREYLIERNEVHKALYEFASGMYTVDNGGMLFLIGLCAVICAIQGFSYLYDRNKIDFYHSKPVKATTRFFSIWTNGIWVWLFPYLAGTLLNLVFFAANGIMDEKLFANVWIFVLIAVGLYLCIYNLSVLALMMTGKLIVTLMGILVFLLYELCIKMLLMCYHEYFYQFYYMGYDGNEVLPVLSPITYLAKYAMEEWSLSVTMLALLAFAAVILVVALWCYKRRPCELCATAMTFEKTKSVIKIAIAVPVALCAGLSTCSVVEYGRDGGNAGFPIFVGILALLITCGLMQVIYEADIKGIFHKRTDIVVSFVLAMGIALVFRFDLTGFDTRIPAKNQIEYASLVTYDSNMYTYVYLDEDNSYITKEEYVPKHMKLTGETAGAVRDLMAHSIDLYLQQPDEEAFREEYESSYAIFMFRLKNGSTLCREIPVVIEDAENLKSIEIIETDEEYIRTSDPAMSEYLYETVQNSNIPLKAVWGTDLEKQDLSAKQARELLNLYREDVMQKRYQAKSNELPIGEFRLKVEDSVSYHGTMRYPVYPSYVNCMEYLKTNGFETEKFVDLEEIREIVVSRYYETEEDEEVYEDYYIYSDEEYYEDVIVETKSTFASNGVVRGYTDREQIKEIMESAYPAWLTWDDWYMRYPLEEYWEITVYFKEDSSYYEEYGNTASFQFLEGAIPAFVQADFPEFPDEASNVATQANHE